MILNILVSAGITQITLYEINLDVYYSVFHQVYLNIKFRQCKGHFFLGKSFFLLNRCKHYSNNMLINRVAVVAATINRLNKH